MIFSKTFLKWKFDNKFTKMISDNCMSLYTWLEIVKIDIRAIKAGDTLTIAARIIYAKFFQQ